jgi:phospholipid-binding lipoprotein MlaA
LFDPASSLGLEPHESDFGQTMALAGVGPGPYMVLPVVGPSTVRDGFGLAVDIMFRPSTFVVPLADQLVFTTIQGGGFGLTTREEYYDQLKILRESSIDYYSALRSAYSQSREAEIWDRREHHLEDEEVTPASPPPAAQTSSSRPSPEPRSHRAAGPLRTRSAAVRSR